MNFKFFLCILGIVQNTMYLLDYDMRCIDETIKTHLDFDELILEILYSTDTPNIVFEYRLKPEVHEAVILSPNEMLLFLRKRLINFTPPQDQGILKDFLAKIDSFLNKKYKGIKLPGVINSNTQKCIFNFVILLNMINKEFDLSSSYKKKILEILTPHTSINFHYTDNHEKLLKISRLDNIIQYNVIQSLEVKVILRRIYNLIIIEENQGMKIFINFRFVDHIIKYLFVIAQNIHPLLIQKEDGKKREKEFEESLFIIFKMWMIQLTVFDLEQYKQIEKIKNYLGKNNNINFDIATYDRIFIFHRSFTFLNVFLKLSTDSAIKLANIISEKHECATLHIKLFFDRLYNNNILLEYLSRISEAKKTGKITGIYIYKIL